MAKVLIVEDVPAVRRSLRLMAERQGHAATETTTGTEALARLEAESFDVVVTDVWMPEMDGIALLKAARARGIATPFLVVSGGDAKMPLAHTAALAETFGAEAVLYKPFEEAEFVTALKRLLG